MARPATTHFMAILRRNLQSALPIWLGPGTDCCEFAVCRRQRGLCRSSGPESLHRFQRSQSATSSGIALTADRQWFDDAARFGRCDDLASRRSRFPDDALVPRAGITRIAPARLDDDLAGEQRPDSRRDCHVGRASRWSANSQRVRRSDVDPTRSAERLTRDHADSRQYVIPHGPVCARLFT